MVVALISLVACGFLAYVIYVEHARTVEMMAACRAAGYTQRRYIEDQWYCIRSEDRTRMLIEPVWPGILLDYRAKREIGQ